MPETRVVEPFLEFSQKSVLLVLLQIFAKIGAQEGTWTLQTRINTCFFKIVQAPVVDLFILLSIENDETRSFGYLFFCAEIVIINKQPKAEDRCIFEQCLPTDKTTILE